MKSENTKDKHNLLRVKPLLIVDNVDKNFGSNFDNSSNIIHENISNEEKILLTLIANIIVEIALKETL
ncbi:hypothetical protein D7004_07760 [Pedobacter jejuensis]|uniref:Uncharacterized protein n=1 Tax=Pedobacter jejuensis TaxID=1268550 RepID=A0A3N0BWH7_9SPHI|nr:hypothetical protein D7004_07760 [Pedobacter jejuensis]